MEQIANLFSELKYEPPKRTSERGELLEYFMGSVNAQRDGRKFKKLPIGFFAKKLEKLELKDLYYLKSVCDSEHKRGGSFSRVFFGALKPREEMQ